jgi:hypothetical protein
MAHSTLTISDYQYLKAFRQLFPTRLLRRAVAARGCATRKRQLPLHLLLGLLITWFFKPTVSLVFLVGWFLPASRARPTESALYRARRRLGWKPLRWLRRHVLRPLAARTTDPDAFYQGLRLLALDGSTFTVADTPANERTFCRARNQHGGGGYPLARIVALCEVGTHALLDWVVRGYGRSEVDLARRLWRRLKAGILLLADRNFHGFPLWQGAKDGGFALLLRVQKGPKFPIHTVLEDGSYLSVVRPRRGKNKKRRALPVRVIRYRWTDEQGKVHESRLLTSLLDAVRHPAAAVVALDHRRWEQELVFAEIKAQLATRPMQIRASDPVRVCQEVEGLLLGHYTLRWLMLQASRRAQVPAVELSCQGSLEVLQVRLARIPRRPQGRSRSWERWWEELLQALGQQRLRPRTGRRYPRTRKVTRSHWPLKKGQKGGKVPTLEVVPAAAGPAP